MPLVVFRREGLRWALLVFLHLGMGRLGLGANAILWSIVNFKWVFTFIRKRLRVLENWHRRWVQFLNKFDIFNPGILLNLHQIGLTKWPSRMTPTSGWKLVVVSPQNEREKGGHYDANNNWMTPTAMSIIRVSGGSWFSTLRRVIFMYENLGLFCSSALAETGPLKNLDSVLQLRLSGHAHSMVVEWEALSGNMGRTVQIVVLIFHISTYLEIFPLSLSSRWHLRNHLLFSDNGCYGYSVWKTAIILIFRVPKKQKPYLTYKWNFIKTRWRSWTHRNFSSIII